MWINEPNDGEYVIVADPPFACSACGFSESKLVVSPFTLSFSWVKPSYRYCPNCGAEALDD